MKHKIIFILESCNQKLILENFLLRKCCTNKTAADILESTLNSYLKSLINVEKIMLKLASFSGFLMPSSSLPVTVTTLDTVCSVTSNFDGAQS